MVMETISREDAKAQGLARFFTGIPCSRGHIAERKATSSDCIVCLKARQKAWDAKNRDKNKARGAAWYAAHPERAKATRAAWRERNAEKDRADVAAWQASHKEEIKVAGAAWRAANPDKVLATVKRSQVKNYERQLVANRLWAKRNKHKINAKKSRRIAAKLRACPLWADLDAIEVFYETARNMGAETGVPHHVDHIVPLMSKWVCGLHCEANLQVLTGKENQSKSNHRWPDMPAL